MKTRIFIVVAASALLLTGCETMRSRSDHYTSSLMNYLYPDRESHRDQPGTATLTLPLRVGVAFVPDDNSRANRRYASTHALSEEHKVRLLQEVSSKFRKYPFVKDIEVIPTAYLTPRGGFANLDQLQRMFDVDVMALVSYDQLQSSGGTKWSIAYLTVIGAYLIDGEANDTRTMIDTAVYDIRSRKLLFRAPGLSEIKGSAAPVNVGEELRRAGDEGFTRASTNLVTNLETQLATFRERIKDRPEEVKIVRSAGYNGGGAIGVIEVCLVGAAGAMVLLRRARKL